MGRLSSQGEQLILLGCSLTNGIHEREGCAHATDMCVCTHVRTSSRCLKCTLHFSLNVQNFQKLDEEEERKKKKNSLTLLKTPCATSKLFLVPRASVLSDALYVVKPQPSAFLLLWPQGHLCPSAISERAGPGSALQRPSHIDLQAGRASLLLFILSSPQSSLMTC